MSIIFGSLDASWKPRQCSENMDNGYSNIAIAVDGYWRNLYNEIDNEHDVVLCCCAEILQAYHKKLQRPKKWKKFIVIQEAGTIINNYQLVDFYTNGHMNIDGYLYHSSKLKNMFEALNKPVYKFNTPYPFKYVNSNFSTGKYNNKICLNVSKLYTDDSNILGTIRLCQLLPEYNFISYCTEHMQINSYLNKLNVTNWKVLPALAFNNYLNEVKDCGLFVSLDNRHTWGRFQLDAAAMNKRSVGAYSETQQLFYPKDYMVDFTEINKLVELVKENFGKSYTANDDMIYSVSHDNFRNVINTI
jgi:hypothetical protein